MRTAARIALVALAAALAGSVSPVAAGPAGFEVTLSGYIHDFDPGMVIGGETDPVGFVLSPQRVNRPLTLPRISYLEAKDAGIALSDLAGRYCRVHGLLEAGGLSAGGVETPFRTFDLLHVLDVTSTPAPRNAVERLPGRILADLALRGVEFGRDGASSPSGGLSADGMLENGRPALVLPLIVPPEGSADMFTDTAFVDRRGHRYWAVRTGGFAGVTQWVGPFRLPHGRR